MKKICSLLLLSFTFMIQPYLSTLFADETIIARRGEAPPSETARPRGSTTQTRPSSTPPSQPPSDSASRPPAAPRPGSGQPPAPVSSRPPAAPRPSGSGTTPTLGGSGTTPTLGGSGTIPTAGGSGIPPTQGGAGTQPPSTMDTTAQSAQDQTQQTTQAQDTSAESPLPPSETGPKIIGAVSRALIIGAENSAQIVNVQVQPANPIIVPPL